MGQFAGTEVKGPVHVRQATGKSKSRGSESSLHSPLMQLSTIAARGNEASFIGFESNGQAVGELCGTLNGGVALVSSSGDFAEWHLLADKDAGLCSELSEGTVVGFTEGKVSLNTLGCKILGVVTERPVVVGSALKPGTDAKGSGVNVAYCGRVPVRVIGPVECGDILVPSGETPRLRPPNPAQMSRARASCVSHWNTRFLYVSISFLTVCA